MPMSTLEVLTMGRVGADLYPQQVGAGLDQVETFGKWVGGSATNVAVAGARYQRLTAVITRTGDDPFGAMPTAVEVAELLGDGPWEAASA
jgi:5-dehydro-2-deoxygluconokinase